MIKMKSDLSRQTGFTLIEAVLALAILSVSVFVLSEATSRCLAVLRVSRNYQTAHNILNLGESEHPLDTSKDPEENKVDPVKYPNGYTFQRDLTAIDEDEKLYEVHTRVSWSESGKASFTEVLSLFYCPKML